MRAAPTIALRAVLVRFVLVFVLASMAGCSPQRRPDAVSNKADTEIVQFAKHKQAQVLALSQKRKTPVAPEFTTLMEAACRADWMAVSNAYESVRERSGWWAGSTPVDTAIRNELWHPVHEVYWAFLLLRQFHPENLARYREDLLTKLPSGSVLLAGTDSGRFLGTLFLDAQTNANVILITQNVLVDGTYEDYIRDTLSTVRLPSVEEANAAFRQYADEIQSGQVKDDDVSIENGRISVEGVKGMMAINSQLARWIFERNNDKHSFFVEESYVLPWMYPYLSPCGVLMRLDKQPVPTPKDDPAKWQRIIQDNFVFWDTICGRFRARPELWADVFARNTYSKMRCAIAGIYEYRGIVNAAEAAYQQAIALGSANPEASFRLANLYMRLNRNDQAIQTLHQLEKNFPAGDPRVELTRDAIKQFEAAPRVTVPAK